MNPPAVTGSPPGQVAPVSSVPELSDTLSQALYVLIAQQPFFKGSNTQQLKLLTNSALEMKFETGATNFEQRSPANQFDLILKGRVVPLSGMEDRNMMDLAFANLQKAASHHDIQIKETNWHPFGAHPA